MPGRSGAAKYSILASTLSTFMPLPSSHHGTEWFKKTKMYFRHIKQLKEERNLDTLMKELLVEEFLSHYFIEILFFERDRSDPQKRNVQAIKLLFIFCRTRFFQTVQTLFLLCKGAQFIENFWRELDAEYTFHFNKKNFFFISADFFLLSSQLKVMNVILRQILGNLVMTSLLNLRFRK